MTDPCAGVLFLQREFQDMKSTSDFHKFDTKIIYSESNETKRKGIHHEELRE